MKSEYELDCEALERVRKVVDEKRLRINGSRKVSATLDMSIYHIKPEPKRVPLELKDWAGGPWWVRKSNAYKWMQIEMIDGDTIVLRTCGPNILSYVEIMAHQRTRDFINIEPCSREVS